MPDVIFPKGKILAKRGKPTEEIHVNQKLILKKNIIPFCFSHLSHLSQGRKQATVIAITYVTS